MTDFRNDLLTRMIHLYGFEHPETIRFAHLCENYPGAQEWDEALEQLVKIIEMSRA